MILTAIAPDITTAISTVGFPIVMCIALFYYVQKEGACNRKQIDKLSDALTNNTLVITKLLERMEKD